MKKFALAALVILAMPLAAQAQGIIGGAQEGAYQGNRAAGPVGAVVGGTVGAAVGGVEGGVAVELIHHLGDGDPVFRSKVQAETLV